MAFRPALRLSVRQVRSSSQVSSRFAGRPFVQPASSAFLLEHICYRPCFSPLNRSCRLHTSTRCMMAASAPPATASAPSTPVAFIICSARKPRCGPQVHQFVLETLQSSSTPLPFTPHLVDLADWPLPLFDEPVIPQTIHDPAGYQHEHTRRWSAEISKYAGYVFITPQYNWGYPASVKNAIDYLFNEWTGKPGAIISYGGHGGGKAADQLRQVLGGLRMHVAETMPALMFGKEGLMKTQKGELLGVTGEDSIWNSSRPEIIKAMEELAVLLSKPVVKIPKA